MAEPGKASLEVHGGLAFLPVLDLGPDGRKDRGGDRERVGVVQDVVDQQALSRSSGGGDILPVVHNQTEGRVVEGYSALADEVAKHLQVAARGWDITQKFFLLSLGQDADVMLGDMSLLNRTREI